MRRKTIERIYTSALIFYYLLAQVFLASALVNAAHVFDFMGTAFLVISLTAMEHLFTYYVYRVLLHHNGHRPFFGVNVDPEEPADRTFWF